MVTEVQVHGTEISRPDVKDVTTGDQNIPDSIFKTGKKGLRVILKHEGKEPEWVYFREGDPGCSEHPTSPPVGDEDAGKR